MSGTGTSIARSKGQLGVKTKRLKRDTSPDAHMQVLEARRELIAAKLEAHIRAVVAGAPPLTPAMRDSLAALLRGASGVTQ